MISVRDLAYSYGSDIIFDGVSFSVEKNAKVGLVGSNGSGKSTLFRLLSKKENPDSGKIEIEGDIVMVPQEVKRDEIMEKTETIREYLNPPAAKAMAGKQDYELQRILAGLELQSFSLDSKPQNLSGGQRTKLAIGRAVLAEPEILLLDEPTNFLDVSGKTWVMNWLSRYPKTLILVSHDLNLLDNNIDKILDINLQTRKIDEYTGNYTGYVKLKREKEALMRRHAMVAQKHLAQMKEGLVKMAHMKSKKGVHQKMNLQRRVEKMEVNLPPTPFEAKKIKMKIPEPLWVGEMPIMAKNICKSYGDKKVLENVNFDIRRGERIALMGPNGAGKSTLIKILLGKLAADSGQVIPDLKLKTGYYSQEFETFDMEKSVLETVREKCGLSDGALRPLLGRFLFIGDKVFQTVGTLSGGEKTRLSIAALLAQNFNLLILDEPTTYLDVLSQRLILEALKDYQGALIIVSHTPEFIEELHPTRKFLLPENKMMLAGMENVENRAFQA